jgi:hypothetical protein
VASDPRRAQGVERRGDRRCGEWGVYAGVFDIGRQGVTASFDKVVLSHKERDYSKNDEDDRR